LKEIWNEGVPWFYNWFITYQAEKFTTCLVMSARKELGIEGRYYNNPLENRHKSQKKKIEEEAGKTRNLEKLFSVLEKWVNENFVQEISLALRGFGKYRLAPGYQHLQVDPKDWLRMSPETRLKKIEHFQSYTPKPSGTFTKPLNAGKKGKSVKRRVNQCEPELFGERVEVAAVSPIKVQKTANSWEVCLLYVPLGN